MDPLEGTYPGETTHYIAREASRRGHRLAYCTPADLAYESPTVTAAVRSMRYTPSVPASDLPPIRGRGIGCELGDSERIDLCTMDVVLMRQDPPVDARYLAATYLLERLGPQTLVVNHPRAVRDTAEKLSIVHFPDLAPPTLVTSDHERLCAFRERHGDLVVKQLFGKGGEGLFYVKRDDKNWNVIVEQIGRTPVMAQKYIDAPLKKVVVIEDRCRRALQIDAEPDDIRCNLDRGRSVVCTELTVKEQEAAARVAKFLGERGILFAVIDLLGPFVIEVNVTSPGIIYYYNRVYDERLDCEIVDAIERRLRQ